MGTMAVRAERRTRQDVVREFRREQILRVAREVIGALGYGEASIERIAEAADVARSTVYVYFQSKEEILNQCLAENRIGLGERVREAVAKADGLEDGLAAFLEALFDYVGEFREFFLAVMAVRGLDPFLVGEGPSPEPSEFTGIRAESEAVLASILREGVATGEIPERDLEEATGLLGMLLYGALIRRSHQPNPLPAAEEARALAHFYLHGLAGL